MAIAEELNKGRPPLRAIDRSYNSHYYSSVESDNDDNNDNDEDDDDSDIDSSVAF